MPTILHPHRVSTRKVVAITAAVVVILAVAGFFGYQKYEQVQAAHTNQQIWQEANQLDNHQLYDNEYALLKNYEDSHPPKQYRYKVLIQLATLAVNKQNYTAALQWYQQAQTANGGKLEADTAQGLAISEANLGNKQAAINYYRQAIALSDQSPDGPPHSGIQSYQNSIRQLGGTP